MLESLHAWLTLKLLQELNPIICSLSWPLLADLAVEFCIDAHHEPPVLLDRQAGNASKLLAYSMYAQFSQTKESEAGNDRATICQASVLQARRGHARQSQ